MRRDDPTVVYVRFITECGGGKREGEMPTVDEGGWLVAEN